MESLLALDRKLFALLNGHQSPAWLDSFFVFITNDHSLRVPMIILWLLLLLACGPRWRRRALWLVLLIAVSDSLCSHVLKEIFQRLRPCRADLEGLRLLVNCGPAYSFPSSHAMNMGAAGIFLTLGVIRKRLWPLVLLLPVLVAYSRIHVGVHYPLDVLVGFLLGGGLALSLEFLIRRLPPRVGGVPVVTHKYDPIPQMDGKAEQLRDN
ncbi:MAG: phosphatase PAP2 family protein [bacterium]|nr:phosphatase PAP2 family protein [bacterium]